MSTPTLRESAVSQNAPVRTKDVSLPTPEAYAATNFSQVFRVGQKVSLPAKIENLKMLYASNPQEYAILKHVLNKPVGSAGSTVSFYDILEAAARNEVASSKKPTPQANQQAKDVKARPLPQKTNPPTAQAQPLLPLSDIPYAPSQRIYDSKSESDKNAAQKIAADYFRVVWSEFGKDGVFTFDEFKKTEKKLLSSNVSTIMSVHYLRDAFKDNKQKPLTPPQLFSAIMQYVMDTNQYDRAEEQPSGFFTPSRYESYFDKAFLKPLPETAHSK
jgi:hypothetical protein